MELTGEQIIPAPREKVWAALNDPDILRQCIPGCETVTKTSDTDFEAAVQVKVGPVKAKFKGKVTLSDLDPPNSCTISGEAQGGVAAGFGKGGAKVQLSDADGGATRLTYQAQAQVGGKLAQIGARLVDGVAAKMAEDFFAKFNTIVGAPAAAEPAAAAEPVAEPQPLPAGATQPEMRSATPPSELPAVSKGIPSWLWIAGLIAIVCVVTFFVLRR
ncbi:MAG TPA: carbon monoxide dehydrogenase subunit G [Ferrovibrio sp.]|uniref:SRPBCC family protein n=1 Tax=Ferrovibrio sp. TaxID=1917215 RepID=UPI002ECFF48D